MTPKQAVLAAACLALLAGCGEASGRPGAAPAASLVAVSPDPASPAVAASVAAADPSAADQPSVPDTSRAPVDRRLGVILGGQTIYIRNSGRIDLGGGLAVELYADPYPPSALRSSLDFYVTRDGRAVTDASLSINYDMLAMEHGPFTAEAKSIGGGHYLVSFDYYMFGPWEQDVTIRAGLQWVDLPILIVAFP